MWFSEILSDIKANTAGTNDGDLLPDRLMVPQHIEITQYFLMVTARNLQRARLDPTGNDNFIKTATGRLNLSGTNTNTGAIQDIERDFG